jgi:hypothetical protein
MAIAFVGESSNTSGSGNPSVATISYSPTAGNALILFLTQIAASDRTFTISDNIGGTTGWNIRRYVDATSRLVAIGWKANVGSGVTTITVSASTSNTTFAAALAEFSGMGSAITEDTFDSLTESVSGLTHTCSASGVTSANPVIAACAGIFTNTVTECSPGSGYSEVPSGLVQNQTLKQYRIFASGCTSEVGTWTNTGASRTARSTISLFSGAGAGYSLSVDAGSVGLSGTAASFLRGLLVAAAIGSYGITGTAATLSKGYPPFPVDSGSYGLTGTALTFQRGYVMPAASGSQALTGSDITFRRGIRLTADTGALTLSGTAATLAKGYRLSAESGVSTVTGSTAGLLRGLRFDSTGGAYLYTGEDVTFVFTPAEAVASLSVLYKQGWTRKYPRAFHPSLRKPLRLSTPLVSYFVPESGSYAVIGTTATLAKGTLFTASAGSYALTGTDAALSRTRGMTAEGGQYLLTGSAASFVGEAATDKLSVLYKQGWTRKYPRAFHPSLRKPIRVSGPRNIILTAESGTYSIVGEEPELYVIQVTLTIPDRHSWPRAFAPGPWGHLTRVQSFNRLGQSALNFFALEAEPAIYSLSGTDATLAKAIVLDCEPTNYAVTGTEATFLFGRILAALGASYALTGTAAGVLATRIVSLEGGTYALTGSSIEFAKTYRLAATSALYTLTGTAATLSTTGFVLLTPPGRTIEMAAVSRLVGVTEPDHREVAILESGADRGLALAAVQRLVGFHSLRRTVEIPDLPEGAEDMVMFEDPKGPGDICDWTVTWTALLEADTIASSSWIVPTGLTQASPAPSFTANQTTIWLSGGTDGELYDLINTITTAGGRTWERTIRLLVQEPEELAA